MIDYEKAYKDALERAKMILCNIPEGSASVRDIETIFPELRESDDERIRKKVEEAIRGFLTNPIDADELLAYLEKQKELFKSGRGLYYYDGEKTVYMGCPATEENPYDFAMSQQEEKKEPHFTKRNALFDKCVENCDPEIMKRVSDEIDTMLEKEQKPAEVDESTKRLNENWMKQHFNDYKEQEQPIGEEYAIEIGKHTHILHVGSQSDIDNLIRQEKQGQPESFDTVAFQKGVEEGRRLEREDVKSIIQSRIDEIFGDAQPYPILRMELQELIKKIEA